MATGKYAISLPFLCLLYQNNQKVCSASCQDGVLSAIIKNMVRFLGDKLGMENCTGYGN